MKGITIILTLIILAIAMAVIFGIAGIFFSEVMSSEQISSSMKAFYAADAAIEAAIYRDRNGGGLPNSFICNDPSGTNVDGDSCLVELTNKATYNYKVTDAPGGGGCVTRRSIKSVGTFLVAKRSIEINYCI